MDPYQVDEQNRKVAWGTFLCLSIAFLVQFGIQVGFVIVETENPPIISSEAHDWGDLPDMALIANNWGESLAPGFQEFVWGKPWVSGPEQGFNTFLNHDAHIQMSKQGKGFNFHTRILQTNFARSGNIHEFGLTLVYETTAPPGTRSSLSLNTCMEGRFCTTWANVQAVPATSTQLLRH